MRDRVVHIQAARGFTLVEMMVVMAIIAILAGLLIGVSGKTYGANTRNVSEELVGTLNLAKLRAVSARKWHRVEVTGSASTPANTVLLWQWSNFGMATPSGTCTAPATNCWQLIQQFSFPAAVTAWDGSTTIAVSSGTTVTQNTSLDFYVDFKPDGSSTGGTIFLTDNQNTQPWRVLVYRATGSAYGRQAW